MAKKKNSSSSAAPATRNGGNDNDNNVNKNKRRLPPASSLMKNKKKNKNNNISTLYWSIGIIISIICFFIFTNNNNSENNAGDNSSSSKTTTTYSSSNNKNRPNQKNEATKLRLEGTSLVHSNQFQKGLELFDKSIELDPDEPVGYAQNAGVLQMLGRFEDALRILKKGEDYFISQKIKPNGIEHIYYAIFHTYKDLKAKDLAIPYIQKAISVDPKNVNYYTSWASILKDGDNEGKIHIYNKILNDIEPGDVESFCLREHTYYLIGEWDIIQKNQERLERYMNITIDTHKRNLENTADCLLPYHTTYMNISAQQSYEIAKYVFSQNVRISQDAVLPKLLPGRDVDPVFDSDGNRLRKLRIGYVSSDLQNHPVGRNILGMFMYHDYKKYDIYCFATKRVINDPVTDMIAKTINNKGSGEETETEKYIDISTIQDHGYVAHMIRNKYKIDILIDLNGWTDGHRMHIFSAKPSPVQITHGLGFVSTTGVSAFDYYISDNIATPQRYDKYYTESLIRLPISYLPTSHNKVFITKLNDKFNPSLANKTQLRLDNNLPITSSVIEDDETPQPPFVFCSFQSIHKISYESFDIWMEILSKSPNSVLWMTTIKGKVQDKLRERAKEGEYSINPNRIIFGKPQQPGLHLERIQACDLHLDSWPYNAHSTATDVLWAGVPLLVYLSDYHYYYNNDNNDNDSDNDNNDDNEDNDNEDTSSEKQQLPVVESPKMCSRVSASLIHTLGMSKDLIVSTTNDFVNRAIKLSTNTEYYTKVRNDLLTKRLSSDLYNINTYTKVHEKAYDDVFERYYNNKKVSSLDISHPSTW